MKEVVSKNCGYMLTVLQLISTWGGTLEAMYIYPVSPYKSDINLAFSLPFYFLVILIYYLAKNIYYVHIGII